jgi:hypothetical protein
MDEEIEKYFHQKHRAAILPQVEVSEEEFIRRLIEEGKTPEKAQQIAMTAKVLSSQIEINNEMVSII